MNIANKYSFNLPSEEQVIKRNRTITTYYAQLYKNEPQLYKWAGMAAFASFHIGEKLKMWNWDQSGIKTLSITCNKKNRTIEDDFQLIRIINNRIFIEIGRIHLIFAQMDFSSFKSLLEEQERHQLVISAFEKLNYAKQSLRNVGYSSTINDLVWEANIEILWHEQSEVVQPLFDRLSNFFSRAMTFFASFDYRINHHQTSWKTRSRFISFMFFSGFNMIQGNWGIPQVTNLDQRWHWISNDILKKWKAVESNKVLINTEIKMLSNMEDRHLTL